MLKFKADSLSLETSQNIEAVRRLLVLVPAEADYKTARRVWDLAHTLGCDILFLSLCSDEAQEASLRRQLITMSAMAQDGQIYAAARVEMGSNWVKAVKSNVQDGDMIVCFAEQRTGLLHKPLGQILQTNLKVPIYLLSGLPSQDLPQSNPFSQIIGWIGSIGIILGAFLLQVRIMSLSEDWAQMTLMVLSLFAEIWLIWGWNNLFS